MKRYEELSDEALAGALEREMGLSFEDALRAVSSDGRDLGRESVIELLEVRDRQREADAKLRHSLAALDRVLARS
jgi:hypothetical protein